MDDISSPGLAKCLSAKAAQVDIVIVNWNAGRQLADCVKSIRTFGHSVGSIILVDNASTDDSLAGLSVQDLPLIIIRNHENRGFATACNQGAAVASSDYLLFLNADTRLFENSLVEPLAFMGQAENAHIGICGIKLIDESGNACLSYAKFPSLRNFALQAVGINMIFRSRSMGDDGVVSEAGGVRVVDQVIGAFFVVRRSVFEQLGGFDERFFVYFEEVDFALRARKNGWASVCLTGVQCIHIGGGSSRQVKDLRLFYSLRSRVLYGFKHFSLLSAITLFLVTLWPELLGRSVFALARGSWQDFGHVVRGYSMLIKDMPAILREVAEMRGQ